MTGRPPAGSSNFGRHIRRLFPAAGTTAKTRLGLALLGGIGEGISCKEIDTTTGRLPSNGKAGIDGPIADSVAFPTSVCCRQTRHLGRKLYNGGDLDGRRDSRSGDRRFCRLPSRNATVCGADSEALRVGPIAVPRKELKKGACGSRGLPPWPRIGLWEAPGTGLSGTGPDRQRASASRGRRPNRTLHWNHRMHWEELVKEYGYLILLIGTLLEGETIVILAGFLARRGYLDFAYVALISFIGTFFADQTLFQIGRRYGARILDRWPRLRRAVKRVWRLLGRFQNLYIFGSRFLYGFRTISPLALGSAGVATRRFLTFNGLGAMVWAISIPALGYSLGMALESVMAEVHRYELMVLAGMLTVSGVILLIHWLRLRSKTDANHSEGVIVEEFSEPKTPERKENTRRS